MAKLTAYCYQDKVSQEEEDGLSQWAMPEYNTTQVNIGNYIVKVLLKRQPYMITKSNPKLNSKITGLKNS